MSYEVWGEPDDYECKSCEALIAERDEAQEAADDLVSAVERLLGVECGEHSNLNCPWTRAVEFMEGEIERRRLGAA